MTVFRVNSTVDKMIEEFEKAYKDTEGTLTVLDVENQYSGSVKDIREDGTIRSSTPVRLTRDETFRMAACTSVTYSVEKRRDRAKK
jgi:hypothetical protein